MKDLVRKICSSLPVLMHNAALGQPQTAKAGKRTPANFTNEASRLRGVLGYRRRRWPSLLALAITSYGHASADGAGDI